MSRSLLALMLCACVTTGRYNERISRQLLAEHALWEFDRGLELLAKTWKDSSLVTSKATALEAVAQQWLNVREEADPWAQVERVDADGKVTSSYEAVGGWLRGSEMVLRWSPGDCLADSAFLHEVTHALLCNQTLPLGDRKSTGSAHDCDLLHQRVDWWMAVSAANNEWRKEVCQ